MASHRNDCGIAAIPIIIRDFRLSNPLPFYRVSRYSERTMRTLENDPELASLVSLLDTPEFRKRARAHCAICNKRALVTDMALVCSSTCFADRLDQVSRGGA